MSDAQGVTARAPSKPPHRRVVIGVVVALILVCVTVFALYARGGGPLPGWLGFLGPADAGLLDPSTPEEAILRTLRLAGYERAVVGEEDGTVVVRLDVPSVRTAADVELSWQTALGSALRAFPDADRYVAQVFTDGVPYLEVGIGGAEMREAAGSALPASTVLTFAEFVLLTDEGVTP